MAKTEPIGKMPVAVAVAVNSSVPFRSGPGIMCKGDNGLPINTHRDTSSGQDRFKADSPTGRLAGRAQRGGVENSGGDSGMSRSKFDGSKEESEGEKSIEEGGALRVGIRQREAKTEAKSKEVQCSSRRKHAHAGQTSWQCTPQPVAVHRSSFSQHNRGEGALMEAKQNRLKGKEQPILHLAEGRASFAHGPSINREFCFGSVNIKAMQLPASRARPIPAYR